MDHLRIRATEIPKLGFGTWEIEGQKAINAVSHALDIGYRHIDTAQIYENEEYVGRALAGHGIERDEIFLVTKVWTDHFHADALARSVDRSLDKLRTDHVDLLLLHWPNPDVPLEETIGALAGVRAAGKAREIGVSNFPTRELARAVEISPAPLAVNQVEYHPYLSQKPVLDALSRYGMALTAYSPLGRGEVFDDETLADIGLRYDKGPGQVALRWLIQQPGVLAIPKAEDEQHARENFAIFDFSLSDEDMQRIFALARPDGRRLNPSFAPEWDNP